MLIDSKLPPTPFAKLTEGCKIFGSFMLIVPFITFILLVLKGLPDFAKSHLGSVFVWVYSVTWIPAVMAGVLLSIVVIRIISKTRYFHQPYDFGRAFSLGAITGALMEALATTIYRTFFHRLFSDFWIAGAMIAGCFAGGIIVAAWLWNLSIRRP